MLNIKNLTVKANDKIILDNFNLSVKSNEVVAIMGKNGSGKSTLCKAILNHPDYKKKGTILFNGEDITNLKTDEISKKGIYYLMQSPTEIEGVTNASYIKEARKVRGIKEDVFQFNKVLNDIIETTGIDKKYIHHNINERLSGGEKKKNELLGLYALSPSLILLDELDSGLDIDSLKSISKAINEYRKKTKSSIIIITHHDSILSYIKPDMVHVIWDKNIKLSGDLSLAKKIEKQGFSGTINMTRSDLDE